MKICASLFFLLGAAVTASAQTPTLAPGEYITDRGWGTLVIKPGQAGALRFNIDAMGANGHSCTLDGDIRGNLATLEAMEKDKPCVVSFTPGAEGVKVEDKDATGSCRYYCGARAGFTDLYLKVTSACTGAAQARAQKAFDQQYRKKNYAAARDQLAPLLSQCGKALYLWTEYRLRNDLAITLHHLREDTACREVLSPLKQYALMPDKDINDAFPPTDAEAMIAVAKAARTNLRLCGDAALNGKK